MPVLNPKTGEEDYVNISIVHKIVIDAQHIQDMTTNHKHKVNFSLIGNEEKQEVHVAAVNKDIDLIKESVVPLQSFEEMLFKAVNECKGQRLEEVDQFVDLTNQLVADFIDNSRTNNLYYAQLDKTYKLTNGIGVIRDIKANQEVGTFESLEYAYKKNQRITRIEGIMLSGRSFDDLSEKERFEYAFYSLEHQTSYSIMTSKSSAIATFDSDSTASIINYDLLSTDFNERHNIFELIKTSQEMKSLMLNIDESHPLYDVNLQEFRQNRLNILEASKQKQKKEQLVSQFADIDLDF